LSSKWALAVIFLLMMGVSDSIYLTYHHYEINILAPEAKSFCAISKTIDCDKAATSAGSMMMGIPVATWGMFAFFFIMFFILVERILYWEVQKALYCFIYLILWLMAAFSAYEAFVSFAVLKVVCIMCVILYLTMVFLLISCKRALGIGHLEFFLLLYDLFFRSFSRTLLRKGASVAIIAVVFSSMIAFGLDYKFQNHFTYQRMTMILGNP
jgi:uncharacterized membrane protein